MTNFTQFITDNEEVINALYMLHITYSDTTTTREQLALDLYHGVDILNRLLAYPDETNSTAPQTLSYDDWLMHNKAVLAKLTYDDPYTVFNYATREAKLLGIAKGIVWEI